MGEDRLKGSYSSNVKDWIFILFIVFIIFIIFCGVHLSLKCIYGLPDKSVKPLEGSMFFLWTSIIIVGLLNFFSKREKNIILKNISEIEFKTEQIVIRVSISDKIIKWLVTILSVFFVILSILLTLICIYALPNRTVQPIAGTIYCLCGSIVLSVFIFVSWKNWASKKP